MTRTRNTVVAMVHHGLGDLVMALPMLRDVDERLPAGWRLLLVVKSKLEADLVAQIAWRNPVETLIAGADRGLRGVVGLFALGWRIGRMAPAVFLGSQMAPRLSASLFSAIVAAPLSVGEEGRWRRLGFTKAARPVSDEHKVRSYARFAEEAGLRDKGAPLVFPPLRPGEDAGAPRKSIFLAPGSGEVEKHKRWPAERFAGLLRRLHADDPGRRLVLFGAKNELPLLSDIRSLSGLGEQVEIAVPARIEDSIRALREADCVVCGCTGTAHLAALADRPAVCLFGPTNPAVTGPYSDRMIIFRLGLGCSPCYRPGFQAGCGDPVCMQEIAVEQVFSLVGHALKAQFAPRPVGIRTTAATAPDRSLSTSHISGSDRP